MKIFSVGAELFHADKRTDRHNEANSRFSQFCEQAYNIKKNYCAIICMDLKEVPFYGEVMILRGLYNNTYNLEVIEI